MFDNRDVMELINLAAYLEGKAERGLFPKARFRRYSDTLERLMYFLADDDEDKPIGGPPGAVSDTFRRLAVVMSSHGSAQVLTHPRFRGRK